MFKISDKALIHFENGTVEGEIISGRQHIQIGGNSATKHCMIDTSVWGWGYKVRAPIVQSDGTLYLVRGIPAMGISNVDENLIERICD